MSDHIGVFDPADSMCVAVFAARETPAVLEATLIAIQAAIHKPTTIDVLVNGNRPLAEDSKAIIAALSRASNLAKFRLWFVPLGDKAHTWNVYLQTIWPGDGLVYFIDGYARPFSNALDLIEQALCANEIALGASGVPTIGRTAGKLRAAQIRERGIHGNLFCLRADTMRSLRASGFHLPLGLYRTDSTIAAVLKFSLNPAKNPWNPDRIVVEGGASWVTDEKHWWSYSQWRDQFKRLIRQAQGDLENRAVRHHLSACRRPPEAMPVSIHELVGIWLKENPLEAARLLKSPLRRYALNQVQRPRDWSLVDALPELMEVSANK